MRPSVMFRQDLWQALMDFYKLLSVLSSAYWEKDELIRFGVRRSKVKVIEWRHTELDGVRLIVSPPLWSLTELS